MPAAKAIRIYSAPLSGVAQGYTNPDLIAERVAPVVLVDADAVRFYKFGKGAFRTPSTERGANAPSNRMVLTDVTIGDAVLREYDMAVPVDVQELDAASSPPDPGIRAAKVATDIIKLGHEKRVADLVFNAANFATANKATLAGNSQWSHASATPITAVKAAQEVLRKGIGRYGNQLTIGAAVFNALSQHPTVLDAVKYSQMGIVTEELLARLLGVERVVVGKAIYTDAQGNSVDVWGKFGLLHYNPGQAAVEVPSLAYTFRRRGHPIVDEFTEEGGKITYYRATDKHKVELVGADAGFLWSEAVA